MSVSQSEFSELNDSIPIAIIYAKNDLLGYVVEMRYHSRSYFIMEADNHMVVYASLEQAKRAARLAGAVQAYLACDRVDDETDKFSPTAQPRFSYQWVDLATYY